MYDIKVRNIAIIGDTHVEKKRINARSTSNFNHIPTNARKNTPSGANHIEERTMRRTNDSINRTNDITIVNHKNLPNTIYPLLIGFERRR
jgi:hypothetical protein